MRKWLFTRPSVNAQAFQEFKSVWALMVQRNSADEKGDNSRAMENGEQDQLMNDLGRFLNWDFENSNITLLRSRLIELLRLRDDFTANNNGNGVGQVLFGMGYRQFNLSNLDQGIALLAASLGEENPLEMKKVLREREDSLRVISELQELASEWLSNEDLDIEIFLKSREKEINKLVQRYDRRYLKNEELYPVGAISTTILKDLLQKKAREKSWETIRVIHGKLENAKKALNNWDGSIPLPKKEIIVLGKKNSILDLDALAGHSPSRSFGQASQIQGGFLLLSLLIVVPIVFFILSDPAFFDVVFLGSEMGLSWGVLGATVGGMRGLSKTQLSQAFLNDLINMETNEIYPAGIRLMEKIGNNPEDIRAIRDMLFERGLIVAPSGRQDGRAIKQLQKMFEIRLILADVKGLVSGWRKGSSRVEFPKTREEALGEINGLMEKWAIIPQFEGEVGLGNRTQREMVGPVHQMGYSLLIEAVDLIWGEEGLPAKGGRQGKQLKLLLNSIELAGTGLFHRRFSDQYKYIDMDGIKRLDFNLLVEKGKPFQPQRGVFNQVISGALFNVPFFEAIINIASSSKSTEPILQEALSKLGISWAGDQRQNDPNANWWKIPNRIFVLSAKQIKAVIQAAGFAVEMPRNHDPIIKKVLGNVQPARRGGVPLLSRVHVLRTQPGVEPNLTENEMAFFVRDATGHVDIYVHEKTLSSWELRGKFYQEAAVMIMFYHEWAESFDVKHEDLEEMGLTIKGLEDLLSPGYREEDVRREIMARGMLAMGMAAGDPRVLDVKERAAESVLLTLIPEGIPAGIEDYVSAVAGADRRNQAHRTSMHLWRSLPGFQDDSDTNALGTSLNTLLENAISVVNSDDADPLERWVREETERLSLNNVDPGAIENQSRLQTALAKDILGRVFRMLNSGDSPEFYRSAPVLSLIKRELALLHQIGGSLYLSFSRVNDAERTVSPGFRRLSQERDLAWLDQLPLIVNYLGYLTDSQRQILNKTSVEYEVIAVAGRKLLGAFQALDDSLLETGTTPVLRISNELLAGTEPLTGPQRTALNVVSALAKRATEDPSVANRVVFLLDETEQKTPSMKEILEIIEGRLQIESGTLNVLSEALVLTTEGLFTTEENNGRTVRTYQAKVLFERIQERGLPSQRLDIYSVPPTDTLAEVWDISGLDKSSLILRLIELWAGNAAIRVSSEYDEEFVKRMKAVRTSA
ncbi:MAG: hypothetical protein IPN90_05435 [Elusimicrobia bacterium]|nr:hypothetical protein [Elusimicrobiota bacterium]